MDCAELNQGYNFTAGNGADCGAFAVDTGQAMIQAVAYGLGIFLFILAVAVIVMAMLGGRNQ